MKSIYLSVFTAIIFLCSISIIGQSRSIKMLTPNGSNISGEVGIEFVIEVEVGNPNSVSDLVGVSFNLEWDNSTYIEGKSTAAGSFFGSNPLIVSQNFDGRIEVGVSSSTGGKNGTGIVARCTLRVKQAVSSNISISFNLTNISGLDGNGNSVTLNPENNPIIITLTIGTPPEDGSIKMISQDGNNISGALGTEFVIEVEVGNPNSVSDLVGVSFNLEWDNSTYIEGKSTVAGSFFGSNPLIVSQNFDGRIEVGVSSSTGGKSGSGKIVLCTLRVKQTVPSDTDISFNLTNITGLDGSGNTVPLNPENNPIIITLAIGSPAEDGSIKMLTPSNISGVVGTKFVIEVEVGNPSTVSDLVGVSFNLEWDNSTYIEAEGAAAGSFFGGNPLIIESPFDGRIEVGVSSSTGGKSGTGIVAQCTLRVKQAIATNTSIQFNLTNTSGLDGSGNSVTLNPENNPVILTVGPPPESSSIKMIDPSGGNINGEVGSEFVIEIEVGNPNTVSDLVGVSFNLEWDNSTYIEGKSTAAGSFFGGNPLIIAPNFDGRIEVGVSSSTGGKNGTGIVARDTLRVKQAVSSNISISFNLTNISGLDGNGNTVTLNPENNPFIVVITDINDEKFEVFEFNLSQNYPNPFNPTTVINYQLPKLSMVTLKVYNMLGEEVATLVNREQTAGNYEVNFDAANLSSGIYYYRIQAGNLVESKKMLLLK